MADFLEERLSDLIRYGSSWQDEFAVNIVGTSGGQEYRSLIHPYPVRVFDISYMLDSARLWSELVNVYMRAHGTFAGFRARCFDEWSTSGPIGTPTAFDHALPAVVTGQTYQLVKKYGIDKAAGASGYATRIIKKPVSGTTKVAVSGIELSSTGNWSVDNTTGIVTFTQNNLGISGISKEASAVITLNSGHGLSAGKSVYFSGVGGMTQINGLRGTIIGQTVYTITVNIDSSGFSTWTSGGIVSQSPVSGEVVTGGCEFDFPVRFATALPVGQDYPGWRPVEAVQLIELLNP